MEKLRVPNWLIALAFLAGSMCVFLIFNWSREPVKLECRFEVFGRELDAGAEPGMFPKLYGEAYPDYPSSHALAVHCLSKLFGGRSTLASVLPSVLCLALCLELVFLIGAMKSRRLGIMAAFILMMTVGFVSEGRSVSLDAFVCLGATGAFWCAQGLSIQGSPLIRRCLWGLAGLMFMCFALVMRGPIGFVVAATAFMGCFIGQGEWRKMILAGVATGAVFVCGLAGFLGLAYAEGGRELLGKVLDAQIGGRLGMAGKPWFYYFTNGMGGYAIAFPLAVAALAMSAAAVWRRKEPWRNPGKALFWQSMAWGLLIVCGLSVPGTRHLRYILPAAPAFALAAAHLLDSPELFGLGSRICGRLKKVPWGHALLAALAFDAVMIFIVERLEVKSETAKGFVEKAEGFAEKSGRLVFYKTGPDGDDIKFICHAKRLFNPSFISDAEGLSHEHGALAIAREGHFQALPPEIKERCEVVAEGGMGGKEYVAFIVP